MSDRRIGPILSLLRQGATVGIDFGAHSLETLVRVAETVEAGVYRAGSLARTADGVGFVLDNPPLRVGAFSSVAVALDGRSVAPESARLRAGALRPWRGFHEVSADSPLELRPGVPTEFAVATEVVPSERRLTVRLELTSLAIPPLVWIEFTDVVRPAERP